MRRVRLFESDESIRREIAKISFDNGPNNSA